MAYLGIRVGVGGSVIRSTAKPNLDRDWNERGVA